MHFFLLHISLSNVVATQDIPDAVLEQFKERNLLKDNFDVKQNMQDMTGGSFAMDGETISYEYSNLAPITGVFTESATYYMNGVKQPNLPANAIFRCKSHPEWKVSMSEAGKLQQASMNKGTRGDSMNLVPLELGSNLFVAFRPDDIDPTKLAKFELADEETIQDRAERSLRMVNRGLSHNNNHLRALQECSSFTVIEVASKCICS